MVKIFDHESPEYAESWNKLGGDKYNGIISDKEYTKYNSRFSEIEEEE